MTLQEYKVLFTSPLKPRTVTFLLKEDKVLLGFKKSGFGIGNYIGIGGKVEEGETIEEAAIREVSEEIDVTISELTSKGIVNFYFPKESWNQEVHIFVVTTWQGEPKESEEINPKWFTIDELPFDKMWNDAQYWIPQVLKGEQVTKDFLFNDELLVVDSSINKDFPPRS